MLTLTLCACERFSSASGELNRSTVVKEILITAQSGARGTSNEKTAIITSMQSSLSDTA